MDTTSEKGLLMKLLLPLDLMPMLRQTPTMVMGGDTGARRRGQLMRILKFLVLTPRLKLMLMASTHMDMAMFTPTDTDTTLARGLLMKLLFLDLMLMLRLIPTMGIGVDTTDPTMAMAGDTGERRKGQLMRILKPLVLTPRLKLMLMDSTPMDMAMFDPTDMDTTSEKGLLMKLLLLLDLM